MQINRKHLFYICFSLALILFVECLIIFKPFIKIMELYTLFLRVNPDTLKPILDFGAETFVFQSAMPTIPNVSFTDYPLILDIFYTMTTSAIISLLIFCIPNIFIDFCLGISIIFSFCIFTIYMSRIHGVWIPIIWPCLIQLFFMFSSLLAKASHNQTKHISMIKLFGYDISKYPNSIPYVKNIISEPQNTEITLAYFRMKIPQIQIDNSKSEDIVYQLNEIFDIIIDTALKYSAVIDKTSSNSIVVYWIGKNNAQNAVKAAMEIDKILSNKTTFVRVTMGISTESSLFALLGSKKFSNYTIIGPNLEIATRLENACIFHNTSILISGNTLEKMKNKLIATHKGTISVHGILSPINFYAPERLIEE